MTDPSTSATALPNRLSPSRAKDFIQCPRLFSFKTIEKLVSPPTPATAKGTVAHTVFERLFDLARDERTEANALAYVAPAWEVMVNPLRHRDEVETGSPEAIIRDDDALWSDDLEADEGRRLRLVESAESHRRIIPEGSAEEAALLGGVAGVVSNYFTAEIERPWNFDPVGRELHLESVIEAPAGGVTLHGFIDRLDRYPSASGEERWVISDYKTGKVPSPRYLDEAFFAMKIYALLLLRTEGIVPHSLRLIFVGADKTKAIQRLEVDDAMVARTEATVTRIWGEIVQSATHDVWEAKKGPLCGWCAFKTWCPAWGGDPTRAAVEFGAV